MGFILGGLDAESYDRKYSDRELVGRIALYFRPVARQMGLVALTIALSSLFNTARPLLISRGIDLLALRPSAGLVALVCLAILISGAAGWLFNYWRQRLSARAVARVVVALAEESFARLLQQDMSFFDEQATGKLVARITSDSQDFGEVVNLVMNLMSQLLLVLLLLGVLFWVNWALALLVLATAPVIIGFSLAVRRLARLATLRAKQARALVNANIQESLSGIAVAKAFRREAGLYDEFREVNEKAYRIGLLRGLALESVFPLLDLLAALGTALVVYAGGLQVLGGRLSAGSWYLFVQGLLAFWFPLTSIASFWSQFQDGLAAAERVFSLIDAQPKVVQRASKKLARLQGQVEFREVDFSYDSGQPVLERFCLLIRPREKVAFVGHTGAGKSSLVRLVARLYEFQGGQLLVDGEDIRNFDLAWYHRQVGLVPQVPYLFSGTVRENIRYAVPEASDEEVEAAARAVAGGDWLQDLPQGLDTDVGERGARLSLGQRQLVALARVLLQDPAILLLDEATASIDPFTEAQIQEGLELALRERTAIIVAHRLSTVRRADRIIVLEQGRIIEEGTHEELLLRGGHYAQLYNTYFRHQSLDYVEQARALGLQGG